MKKVCFLVFAFPFDFFETYNETRRKICVIVRYDFVSFEHLHKEQT